MPIIINTISGQVGFEPQWLLDDPNLNRYLKVVPEGTKPLVEGMFKAGTVEEFNAQNNNYPDNEPDADGFVEPVVSETPADEDSPATDPNETVVS